MRRDRFWQISLLILFTGVLVTGCGYFRRKKIEKEIRSLESTEVAHAENAGAVVYATERWTLLIGQVENAKTQNQDGNFEAAENAIAQAKTLAARAIKEANENRTRIEQTKQKIEDLLMKSEEFLEKAAAAPRPPETEITTGREEVSRTRFGLGEAESQKSQTLAPYDSLLQEASAAWTSSYKAYNLVLREQAGEMKAELSGKLEEIASLEPNRYNPERYREVQNAWDNFQGLMDTDEYARALDAGRKLLAEIPEYHEQTRELRAEVTIQEAEAARDRALAEGAGVYALDFVERCEAALTQARESAEGKDYVQAFLAGVQATQHAVDALAEVQRRAEDTVQRLKAEIETAVEEEAEQYAADFLDEARELLGMAVSYRDRKEYKTSLDKGKEGLTAAGSAIIQSKRIKAENDLGKTQRSIDLAVEEAADLYAAEILQEAQDLYQYAKGKYNDGDYSQVHILAGQAREKAEEVLRILERAATQFIREAEIAIDYARTARAEEYARETLMESVEALGRAKVELGNDFYRRSIEESSEAIERAGQAEKSSYHQRAEATLRAARAEREAARQAGALEYQPEYLNQAIRALQTAENRFAGGNYKAALHLAEHAQRRARQARIYPVLEAEDSIGSAYKAKADQYAAAVYDQAVAALTTARDALDVPDYPAARRASTQALQLARQAEQAAWRERARATITEVESSLQNLVQNLAEEHAPLELAAVRVLQTGANSALNTSRYYEAFRLGSDAQAATLTCRAALAAEARKELEFLLGRSSDLAALAQDEFGRARRADVFPHIETARDALTGDQYRQVFQSSAEGKALADRVQIEISLHNIETRIAQLEEQLMKYQQSGLSSLLPSRFEDIASRVAAADPVEMVLDYEIAQALLDDLENDVESFPGEVDRTLDRVISYTSQTLQEALRAEAMQHNRDRYVDALQKYKDVVAMPREDYFELANAVYAASEAANETLATTLVSIDESAYLSLISDYLTEFSSILEQWPFSNQPGTGKYHLPVLLASHTSAETDVYRELQSKGLSDEELVRRAEDRYRTVLDISPPRGLQHLHAEVVYLYKTLAESADLFHKFGMYGLYGPERRRKFLEQAYDKLAVVEEQTFVVQEMVQGVQPSEKSFWDRLKGDRGWNPMNYFWIDYEPE